MRRPEHSLQILGEIHYVEVNAKPTASMVPISPCHVDVGIELGWRYDLPALAKRGFRTLRRFYLSPWIL